MASDSFEYCILGGGVVGSWAAYLLSRAGHSVVLLEQYDFLHEKGSSHGESRITRYSYDHPNYVAMAKRAFPLWEELAGEANTRLFLKTGGLDLDEDDGASRIQDCIESLRSEKIDFELLDKKELKSRFPQFRVPDSTRALYQKDAGILNASLCLKSLQDEARKHGAQLKANSRLTKIEHEGKHLRLWLSDQSLKAKKLILAGGAWMGALLSGCGLKLPLTVSQEQYAFFRPLKPELFEPGTFPVFIHNGGIEHGGMGWYGFPIFGRPGVKSSIHMSGKQVSAGTRDFIIDPAQLAEVSRRMESLLPEAAGEIIHSSTCLYTNSADQHFVIDRLPHRDNVVYFTGCSGHAFKFGGVIAEVLIDLLNNRETKVPLALFQSSRFAQKI